MNQIKENKEIKEIKAEEIRLKIFNSINRIRYLTYNIIRIMSKKLDNNNYDTIEINNNNKNELNNNNININKELLTHWDNIKNTLEYLNNSLNLFKYTSYFNINDYYYKMISYSNNYKKSLFYRKNDFYILIFKDLINTLNNKILKDIINAEKKYVEIQLSRIRFNKSMKEKIEDSKSINYYINEYIKNNLNEQLSPKNEIKIPIQNIYFNCEIITFEKESIAHITIEFCNFYILIKIPFNKQYNVYNYLYKIYFLIRFKYYLSDDPYHYNKSKEVGLINKLDMELNKTKQLLKSKNYFLFNKMNNFLVAKIYVIIKTILDEKKKIIVEKDVIIELCKRFIYYIYDYNNIFKTKCGICNKIVKYSLSEKCFYPPYIKIYKERDNFINKINNEETKLFYHEECYKRL